MISNFQRCFILITVFILIWLPIGAIGQSNQTGEYEQLFQHVFGEQATFDAAFHQQVVSSATGDRHYRDFNGDGVPEEVWFIDTDTRHPESFRPLLVKVIDEDDDLEFGYEPDLDSDLYIADWKADGTVDAVLDYTDQDGDNDVDEMGMYFIGSGANYFSGPTLRVWWGRDDGDDNLLWYNVGYTYNQRLCQYRTHFGGEETFVAFALSPDGSEWIPFFENPFLFYDHDRDGVTEEVLRLSGIETEVETMRHSFDADNDASINQPRDFDASITAWAQGTNPKPETNQRGRSTLHIPQRYMDTITLRGIPCRGYLAHAFARHFVQPVTWKRMMLTWDEIDLNVDAEHRYEDFDERWEGVIAEGNNHFPQVGGPSCGPDNKRYEMIANKPSTVELYFHPFDNRIHLKHSERSWLNVDWNLDRTVDMRYRMLDTNGDGCIDRYQYDMDADGEFDDRWNIPVQGIQEIQWSWADVSTIRKPITQNTLQQQRMENHALIKKIQSIHSPEWPRIHSKMPHWDELNHIPESVVERLQTSAESQFYLLTLQRDYLLCALKKLSISETMRENLDSLRNQDLELDIQNVLDLPSSIEGKHTARQSTKPSKYVAWAEDKSTTTIGWESNRIAYAYSRGKFRFYGKQEDRLIYTNNQISKTDEQAIEALQVENTPGCGGLTLYIDQTAYPLWSDEASNKHEYSYQLITETNQQVIVEIVTKNVGKEPHPFTVRLRCTANAERMDTAIQVRVEGTETDTNLGLGIGLTKLSQETVRFDNKGVLGVWGIQTPKIGRIGMGIIIPDEYHSKYIELPNEHQLKLDITPNEWITYYIQCDWLSGHRFPYSPSAEDWFNRLTSLCSCCH